MQFPIRLAFWVILVLGGSSLASCSREAMPPVEEGLVGKWEWEQTMNTHKAVLTPANTGHRMTIRFDRQGRVSFYQDDVLVSAATFTVRRNSLSFWEPTRYIISYQGYRGKQFYSVVGNELQLEDANEQLATHRYQRIDTRGLSVNIIR